MVWDDIERIRQRAPLVHNITNYVAMNVTANALLAVGASPVMAHAVEEVEDFAAMASALVINIGTLSPAWVDGMIRAARVAKRGNVPIVLDPVGSGATAYRTSTAERLIAEAPPTVIRGNASEILSLATGQQGTRGVDSVHDAADATPAARRLAECRHCVVSMSGPMDVIAGVDRVVRVRNGHPIMPRVTALGCVASALTGAFIAVNPSSLDAAAHAMILMGVAGEIAAERSSGPASFQTAFIDALFGITESDLAERTKAEGLERPEPGGE